jgi:hypothetical protein
MSEPALFQAPKENFMSESNANTNKNAQPGAGSNQDSKSDPVPGSQLAAKMGVEPPKVEKKEWPKVARVRSVVGRMVHLITGQVIDGESDKKITIDGFARSQLDAGKWVVVTD